MKKRERPEDGWPWQASPNRLYFVYDPDGDGFLYYATEEERDDAAKAVIDSYLEDGWDGQVRNIVAGKLTHTAQQTNLEHRPTDDELDEDGCDEEGVHWDDFDHRCNYELLPIKVKIEAE